jgi:excisionase family DNA binding protein
MERAAVQAAPSSIQTATPLTAVKPEPLLTRDEVAAYWRVSSRTVDRAVQSGWLPAIKLGPGRNAPLRFRRSQIEAAINQQ